MPGWLKAVVGAAEIAGGAALDIWAGGAGGFGNLLIKMGIGTEIGALGTMLGSKGPVDHGGSTASRNPIGPREVGYGRVCSGGNPIYINQFGNKNKFVDMIFDLSDFGEIQGVTALMIDRQVVQIDTTAVPAGVPASTYPFINGGMSFAPKQQNGMGIYWIERIGGTVTLVSDGSNGGTDWGDIPLLAPGSRILVEDVPSGDGHVPGDSTVNGRYAVQSVVHHSAGDARYPTPSGYSGAQRSGTYCIITYTAGGVDTAVFRAGHLSTVWPTYGSRIYMEVLRGNQTLGQTFVGMIGGTPDPSNIHGGAAITYQNQGYGQTPWTSNHSGVGSALVHVRFAFDAEQLPFIPQVSFQWQGRNSVYNPDPVNSRGGIAPLSHGYTENAALCIADFMRNSTFGYGMQLGVDIDTDALITAAAVCDEAVPLAAGGTEPRYALNGRFPLNMRRGEILQNMMTAMAGRIRPGASGYVLRPAKWAGPAAAGPGISNLLPIEFSPTPTIEELFNGVKGTYIWPGNNWQPSDFPPYAQDTKHGYGSGPYSDQNVIADGGDRRWKDIQLPFTISPPTAQRLAKYDLMLSRKFLTATLRYNLLAYQFTSLDVISETFALLGWTAKEFEVLNFRFMFEPTGCWTELDVQETDVDIFDWDPATEELTPADMPQIAVPTVLNTSVPTNLQLESDQSSEFIEVSGKTHSRILATWVPPLDGYVLSGGHIEVQFQLDGDAIWTSLPSVDPNSTFTYISDVVDGEQYNVRIRSVNAMGIPSNWVQAGPVTVSSSGAGSSIHGPNGGNQYPVLNDALYPVAMFTLIPKTAAQYAGLLTPNNADGSVTAGAEIDAVVPANNFSTLITTPLLSPTITYASTGGSIAGGTNGFIAIVCKDSSGNFTRLSNIVPYSIPAGTNTNTLTITPTYDVATSLVLIYTGDDEAALFYRRSNSPAGTITLTTLASAHGDSYGMPDPNFDHFVVGTTKVLLAGSFGGTADAVSTITGVTPSSGNHYQLALSGAAFTPSALIGRVLSSIVQGAGNPTPLQDYLITANNATSVTVVAPPPGSWGGPVPSFAIGDQVVIRLKPTTYTGFTIGDSLLAMATDQYANKVIRVFYSNGTNQTAFVGSNTATTFTVLGDSNFTGSTPVWFWIEESSFSAMIPGTAADVSSYQSTGVGVFAPIDNLAGFFALQVFASDAFGNLSAPQYSPVRDFWSPGYAGGSSAPVIVSVSTTATIGAGVDQVSIDGTTGPFTVTIEPVSALVKDITLVRTDAPVPIPPAWPASTAVILSYQILDPNGHVQEVTTPGTTDATIPASWSTSGGTTSETGGSAVIWTDQGVFVPSPVITIASTSSTIKGAATVALDNYALSSFTVTKP